MTQQEERELLLLARRARRLGDRVAAQRAVERIYVAGNWQGRLTKEARKWVQEGVELEEFISAGQVGLLEAIERWSPKHPSWWTYAYFWIRKRMAELSRIQGAIVIEREHEVRLVNLVAKVTSKMERTGKNVTVKAVQRATGLTKERAERGMEGRRPRGWASLPEERAENACRRSIRRRRDRSGL